MSINYFVFHYMAVMSINYFVSLTRRFFTVIYRFLNKLVNAVTARFDDEWFSLILNRLFIV